VDPHYAAAAGTDGAALGTPEQRAQAVARVIAQTHAQMEALRYGRGAEDCRCPHIRAELLNNKTRHRLMSVEINCNDDHCPACGRRIQEEWLVTIRGHHQAAELLGLFEPDPDAGRPALQRVIIDNIPAPWDHKSEWPRAFEGRYVAGVPNGGPNLTRMAALVADPAAVKLPAGATIRVVSKEQFAAEAEQIILQASRGRGEIHAGTAWKKPSPKRPRKGEYEKVGGLAGDWKTNLETLKELTGILFERQALLDDEQDRLAEKWVAKISKEMGTTQRLRWILYVLNTGHRVSFELWADIIDGDDRGQDINMARGGSGPYSKRPGAAWGAAGQRERYEDHAAPVG
jgi:hypothetical protein